jgi:hypothetical protein
VVLRVLAKAAGATLPLSLLFTLVLQPQQFGNRAHVRQLVHIALQCVRQQLLCSMLIASAAAVLCTPSTALPSIIYTCAACLVSHLGMCHTS